MWTAKWQPNSSQMADSISPSKNSGFTLIELLCVITIIAILSSLLMPQIEMARNKAKRISCEANLHEIGYAVQLYLTDHDNTYPYIEANAGAPGALDDNGTPIPDVYSGQPGVTAQSLLQTLQPYGASLKCVQCPADMESGTNSNFNKYGCSYMWIPLVDGDYASNPQILRRNGLRTAKLSKLRQCADFTPVHVHAGSNLSTNTLYADGHVQATK